MESHQIDQCVVHSHLQRKSFPIDANFTDELESSQSFERRVEHDDDRTVESATDAEVIDILQFVVVCDVERYTCIVGATTLHLLQAIDSPQVFVACNIVLSPL